MFESLDRASVVKTVISQIQGAMERGQLKRGDRLPPEPELAGQLNVSRGSLREALKVLEVMGLLKVQRGSGTFIAEEPRLPDVDPLLFLLVLEDGTRSQLVDLRFVIEVGFTRLAQPNLGDEDFARLEQTIEDLGGAINAGEVDSEHDLVFHRYILDATDNPFVIQIGNTVLELFRESISRTLKEVPGYAVEHHRLILDALRNGGPEEIEEAVRQSYLVWKEYVRAD